MLKPRANLPNTRSIRRVFGARSSGARRLAVPPCFWSAIVEDTGYLHRVEDIRIIPDAGKLIAAANHRSVPVVIVANRSGVGRGYYGWNEFKSVQDAMVALLAAEDASIDAVYACAHHPQAKGFLAHPNHPARKPNPGMLLEAASGAGA